MMEKYPKITLKFHHIGDQMLVKSRNIKENKKNTTLLLGPYAFDTFDITTIQVLVSSYSHYKFIN